MSNRIMASQIIGALNICTDCAANVAPQGETMCNACRFKMVQMYVDQIAREGSANLRPQFVLPKTRREPSRFFLVASIFLGCGALLMWLFLISGK